MEIHCNHLNNQELEKLCLKYHIILPEDFRYISRKDIIKRIETWSQDKVRKYKSRPRSLSDPNIKSISVPQSESVTNQQQRQRRLSTPNAPQKHTINFQKTQGPPQSLAPYQRDRRMSHPETFQEKQNAIEDHKLKQMQFQGQQHVQQQLHKPEYESVGIFPATKRLIAIGDLHGDLRVTLIALRLAKVIPDNIYPSNLNQIRWIGGDTWIIQLGDQIDRCRPDDWKNNCIEDFDDVVEDEGSNMMIIKLFQTLDAQAKKVGGRIIGTLGNHELMNVDKDYRYVSPQEFKEFVPQKDKHKKYTDDGLPMGYYHRLKAFERGSNLAKHYAYQKKSVVIIGQWLFVHGGLSHGLVSKYTIQEINAVVQKWLLKTGTPQEDEIFDEIFRQNDDNSPFWCRLYSEEDNEGENTEQGFNTLLSIINQRNKLLSSVKRIVVAHTPQFMNDRYLNGIYDERLWRIDVGMSRAFGKHNVCGEDKYRQIQILEIINDTQCIVHKAPYIGRFPGEGMGEKVDIHSQNMPF